MMVFKAKQSSYLMRTIGWFLKMTMINPHFMERYWTTIRATIYYPSYVHDPFEPQYALIVQHELVHVEQYKRFTLVGFVLLYLVFPLPVLLSGKWLLERGPYLQEIRHGVRTTEEAVQALWKYGWPWPRSWMRKWFERELIKSSPEHWGFW